MQIRVEQFGCAFSTRPRGKEVASEVVALTAAGVSEVTLNFQGVRAVSYSFADELVAVLTAQETPVSVVGTTAEIEETFSRSLERRALRAGVFRLPACAQA